MDVIRSLSAAVKNLVTRGVVLSSSLMRARTVLTATALANEEFSNIELMQPYGMSSLPLPGGDLVLLANLSARNGLMAIHCDDSSLRIVDLLPGEFGFMDQNQSMIVFRQDRIEIVTPKKLNVVALGDINITSHGQVNLTVDGKVFAKASEIDLIGPVKITGPLTVSGTTTTAGLASSGNVAVTGNITATGSISDPHATL